MANKQGNQFRQGDVLLTRVDAVPSGAKTVKRDAGRVILAYGEVTGHAHAITEDWAKLFELADSKFLELPKEATLKHEEHAAIKLPAGTYKATIQKEYVYGSSRMVLD